MKTPVAILTLAVLFALLAASRALERTRPCAGRGSAREKRCRACPLRTSEGDAFGACPGGIENRDQPP